MMAPYSPRRVGFGVLGCGGEGQDTGHLQGPLSDVSCDHRNPSNSMTTHWTHVPPCPFYTYPHEQPNKPLKSEAPAQANQYLLWSPDLLASVSLSSEEVNRRRVGLVIARFNFTRPCPRSHYVTIINFGPACPKTAIGSRLEAGEVRDQQARGERGAAGPKLPLA